ncbi:MAG TPA: TlpA disulfide reductase family protein [Thermoanaerobaculia bacterium]|jgi:thiol-disulfide isomerase/thioredoxin
MIDLRFVRYKISAGDLPSAESILEVHRAEKGEDAEYLLGVAWVARGAALLGDWPAASRYAREAREAARKKLGAPPVWDDHSEAAYALGSAIEVDAQALVAAGKKKEALELLDQSSRTLETEKAPYNLRARVWKRRNQIELVGAKAPEIAAEDHLGVAPPPTLASLRGKPVVLFLWWESCGDCKAQAAALRKTVTKYADKDVVFLAPTRYYGSADERAEERGKIEKAWKEIYDLPSSVPVPISDAAMLRYGVSATPTFVFIDRKGVVTSYLPYRMTEERLSQEIDRLLR